jgi:predicted negative regulator of RcsB-dependent stress response
MLYMLDRHIQVHPGAALHIAKGDVYLFMQQAQEARAEYEMAIRISPFNTTAKQRLWQLKAIGK